MLLWLPSPLFKILPAFKALPLRSLKSLLHLFLTLYSLQPLIQFKTLSINYHSSSPVINSTLNCSLCLHVLSTCLTHPERCHVYSPCRESLLPKTKISSSLEFQVCSAISLELFASVLAGCCLSEVLHSVDNLVVVFVLTLSYLKMKFDESHPVKVFCSRDNFL